MSIVDRIKTEIEALPQADLDKLRAWLDELAEQRFDDAIERDAAAGKLDKLMSEAKANYRAGKRRPL